MEYDEKFAKEGFTFDDLLLIPARSSVLPSEVDLSTFLTRKIKLNIPLVSAPMDTVTEARLAIALAREGGIGIIHRNLSVAEQAAEVDKVKRSQAGMIVDPITLPPEERLSTAREIMAKYHISGIPVTENGRLVGIVTNRDIRFETDFTKRIYECMTKDNLITGPVGTTLEEAKAILQEHRLEKLPLVDGDFQLKGLITVKDIQKKIDYPNAAKDELERLYVGAAIGVGAEMWERLEALVAAQVDVVVIDTAHGASEGVIEATREVKEHYPDLQLISGNVATAEATRDLIEAGADGVRVGMGPGTICTSRIVAGMGIPQLTAIYDCAVGAREYDVPVIADGGIRYSGDIAKALAAGACTVMMGNLFAGVDESPGEIVLYSGERFKEYRGMGSLAAMKARGYTADRYFQEGVTKLVPEAIEGRVAYKGPLTNVVFQLMGGLRAGMGYVGAANIEKLYTKGRFIRITSAGMAESHPHDVIITKEAPNYQPPGWES